MSGPLARLLGPLALLAPLALAAQPAAPVPTPAAAPVPGDQLTLTEAVLLAEQRDARVPVSLAITRADIARARLERAPLLPQLSASASVGYNTQEVDSEFFPAVDESYRDTTAALELRQAVFRWDMLSRWDRSDLRAELARWFAPEGKTRLAVTVQSFSYKRGLPRGLDMVLDCRFLRNPYWEPSLRGRDGRDGDVAAYVAADPRFAAFSEKVADLAQLLLPAYEAEGKAYLSIGFGCTGGQHRSVAMAETLAKALADGGWQVSIRHRELERHAPASPPPRPVPETVAMKGGDKL